MSQKNNSRKSYAIFRTNRENKGTATQWELSYKQTQNKKGENVDNWFMFLEGATQKGVDENGNARYDWEKKITVKLGENDIGEILSVLNGIKDSAGYKGSMYHQTPGGGNKSITFAINQQEGKDYNPTQGYKLRIAAQDASKNLTQVQQLISPAEAEILKALLQRALVRMFGW